MIIAYLIYPFNKGKFKNRNIWLVGGNAGELFVDNGRAMYEYLRSKQQEEIYWGAWGANRIRYPGSPRCKRWALGVGATRGFCAVANALSAPPGEYGRKAKTQRN